MADVVRSTPGLRRRSREPGDGSPPPEDRREVGARPQHNGAPNPGDGEDADRCRVAAGSMARRAAKLVATLSGRRPESVVSIERAETGWCVGVEVVEVSRIPDSADILAVFEVRLDENGELISYRRT